jgi:hypothetical protein
MTLPGNEFHREGCVCQDLKFGAVQAVSSEYTLLPREFNIVVGSAAKSAHGVQ